MTADTLRDLAARVEGASDLPYPGGARSRPQAELDCEIWLAKRGMRLLKFMSHRRQGLTEMGARFARTDKGDISVYAAPCFTGSLDAAMSLVPKGWQGDGMKWWEGCPSSCCLVGSVWENGQWVNHGTEGRVEATAATPALALTSCALRALAALDEGR